MLHKKERFVLVWTSRRKFLKRATLIDSTLKRRLDDNTLQQSAGEMARLQQEALEPLAIPKASGAIIRRSPLVPVSAPPASAPPASAPPAPATVPIAAAPDAGPTLTGFEEKDSPDGFGLGWRACTAAMCPPALPIDTPVPKQKGRKGLGSKRSKGGAPVNRNAALDLHSGAASVGSTAPSLTSGQRPAHRPARNLQTTVKDWLAKVEGSVPETLVYWGTEFPTTERWIKRNEKEFSDFMKTVDTSAIYDVCQILMKQFNQSYTIMKKTSTISGPLQDSEEFAEAYDTAHAFLSMPPAARSPMPPFIHCARHKVRVTAAGIDAAKFWPLVIKATLLQHGFQGDVVDDQVEFIAAKMMSMTHGPSDSAKTVSDFIAAAPVADLPESIVLQLDKILCAATQGARRIDRFAKIPDQEVTYAHFEKPDDDEQIVKAFITYQAGKSIEKNFKKHLIMSSVVDAKVDQIGQLVNKQVEEQAESISKTVEGKTAYKAGFCAMIVKQLADWETKLQAVPPAIEVAVADRLGSSIGDHLGQTIGYTTNTHLKFMGQFFKDPSLAVAVGSETEDSRSAALRADLAFGAAFFSTCSQIN